MPVKGSDVLLILVAIIFPPAAAFFITGCGCDLLITIGLTLLGYLPGHLYAFYLIYKKMEAETRYGQGNVAYLGRGNYVQHGAGGPQVVPQGQQQAYGSI